MNQQKLTLGLLAFLALSLLGGLFGINRSLSKLSAETNSIKQTVAEIKNQPNKNEEVSLALATLREELVKYRAEQVGRDQILGLSTSGNTDTGSDQYANLSMSLDQALATLENQLRPTATPTPAAPSVKLNQGWDKVDAHEQPKAGSQIVGQLKTGLAYPLVGKQSGWYQIKLENNALAWVQSQFVYESN